MLRIASGFWHIHPKFTAHTKLLQSIWCKFKGDLNSHRWLLEWCVQFSDEDLQKDTGTDTMLTEGAATAHSILNLLLFIACICQRSQSSLKITHGHDDHTKKIKNCSVIHHLAYKTAILRHSGHAGPSNVLEFSVPVIRTPALCSNRIVSRKHIRLYIRCLISKENESSSL